MKKIIILFLIFIVTLSGCQKEEIILKPQEDNEEQLIEEQRNQKVIEEISSIIENTANENYSFTYNITIDDIEYNYNGQKFDTVIKGNYYTLNKNINYQKEDNKVFDLDSGSIIYDLYKDITYGLINLNEYPNRIKSYTCTINDSFAICQQDDKTITFYFENNLITKVEYSNEQGNKYILNYSDFNNITYIEKIDYEKNNIEYQKSSNINKTTHYNDREQPYYIYNYYIKNATMEIDGERKNITETSEIFEKAMYNLNYDKYTLTNANIQQINHYIYENEFNIIAIKDAEGIWSYYLTTDEYVNNILNDYICFDSIMS